MNIGLGLMSGCLVAGMIGTGGTRASAAATPRIVSALPDTSANLVCGESSGVQFHMYIMTRNYSVYTPNRFVVTLGSGQGQSAVSGDYLLLTGKGEALPNCGVFLTPTSGVLPMTIEVRDGTGSRESFVHPQARIRLELPLKPSWVWSVRLDVSPVGERSDLPHFGPPEQYSRAVALPEGDSLFVHVFGYDPVKSANVVY